MSESERERARESEQERGCVCEREGERRRAKVSDATPLRARLAPLSVDHQSSDKLSFSTASMCTSLALSRCVFIAPALSIHPCRPLSIPPALSPSLPISLHPSRSLVRSLSIPPALSRSLSIPPSLSRRTPNSHLEARAADRKREESRSLSVGTPLCHDAIVYCRVYPASTAWLSKKSLESAGLADKQRQSAGSGKSI